jgi:hypothetical protein
MSLYMGPKMEVAWSWAQHSAQTMSPQQNHVSKGDIVQLCVGGAGAELDIP